MKQLLIKISPTGEIDVETKGLKGKSCLKYISEIEKMTDARVVDSDFTKEYYEAEEVLVSDVETEVNA